jgi:hypothetical protein
MKKTYAAPTLVASGNVVRETKSGVVNPPENTSSQKAGAAGGIGFYL